MRASSKVTGGQRSATRMSSGAWIRSVSITMALAMNAPESVAQQAASRDSSTPGVGQLEEVIVTAEKRSADLQAVPIAIAAFDDNALRDRGISNIKELTSLVPGLTFNVSVGSGLPFLRGVGQTSSAGGVESPISLYVDGTYIMSSVAAALNLSDVERVEVLKGPQGTLFGRNATGGVIHVITKDPSSDPSGNFEVGYGNYDSIEGRFYGTTGLGDNTAVSLGVYTRNQGEGYATNLVTGSEVLKHKDTNAHGKIKWNSDDEKTEVLLNLLYDYAWNQDITASVVDGSLAEDGVTRYVSEWQVSNMLNPWMRSEHNLASLKLSHEFGSVRISNQVSWDDYENYINLTQNGIPGGIRNPVTGLTPTAIIIDQDRDNQTVSNELQVQSVEGSFDWVAGLYYLNDEAVSDIYFRPNNVPTPNRHIYSLIETTSYAAFAQATFPLGQRTRLTTGLRYTSDTLEFSGLGTGTGQPASPSVTGIDTKVTHEEPTWRLALDRDLSDTSMVYASYNRGFKSGRYTSNNFANPAVEPETIDSFEIGSKNEFFDRRLRLNVSVFAYDYKNLQLRATVPGGTGRTLNAADSEGRGMDLDFQAVLGGGFELVGGAEWLPVAEYTRFPGGPIGVPLPQGGVNQLGSADLSGNRMVRAPRVSASLGFLFSKTVTDGAELSFSVNDAYNSGFAWEADNRLEQEPYHNVTASAKWTSAGEKFFARLWGTNLANEPIRAVVIVTSTDTYYPGEPRMYGISFGTNF